MYPDDILTYADIWDKAVKDNLNNIQRVAQPLQKFLPYHQWEAFTKTLLGQ